MEAVMQRGDVDLVLLNPLGIPPWPLSLHPRYRPLRQLAGEELRHGVPVFRPRFSLLPGMGAGRNADAIVRTVLPLVKRWHKAVPFDVIDAQFFYPDGPAAIQIGAELGCPVSIKSRGADIHHWGHAPATAKQVRAAGQAAAGLLAVSAGLADDMAALGMPRDKITLHRTGLDRSVFKPLDPASCRRKLGLPLDVPLLATVGALIPRKGQTFAIAALQQLMHCHLVLAGAGGDEAKLRAQAAELGVADRVHFLGAVPHAALPEVLSAADVFVLPTASEGLANAWVEALACGTPVVTSDIPGARELLTDPAYGRLVQRNSAAIAMAVSELLASPPPRRTIAAAVEGFSWEANAAALVAHWQRLARA